MAIKLEGGTYIIKEWRLSSQSKDDAIVGHLVRSDVLLANVNVVELDT